MDKIGVVGKPWVTVTQRTCTTHPNPNSHRRGHIRNTLLKANSQKTYCINLPHQLQVNIDLPHSSGQY